ncbi:probable disease resistance protein At5g45440 [Phragmites australis]|uniref:probable disease resistance protein At5g45440 n=1 Tax=Phragmites australis TaxID=29695 RepID=UPI002D770CF3|nr:probable disease resistance protein At5g45440 [Phragmites australis]
MENKGRLLTERSGGPSPGGLGRSDDQLLPLSKREELARLLPTIERAFLQCKQPQPEAEHPSEKKMPSASGCNPFKSLPSQQQSKQQGGGGGQEEEEEETVSLKLLRRLIKHVQEPEQYYEWTTSYVDESRIYGWVKDADKVVDALVGPDGDQKHLFRAAGIAGIHGSGKTALAQRVFVHGRVKDNFPLRLWVCVGPPDSEDRFDLLYRMLDNLGLDTYQVEHIVDKSNAVKSHREAEEKRILNDPAAVENIKKKAANMNNPVQDAQKQEEAIEKTDDVKDATKKEDGTVTEPPAGEHAKEQDDGNFNKLLKETVDKSAAVQKSKIGVLLYILHVTLSKTGYLIVFDDIRAYGDDGWYSNLTLLPPPGGEWGDCLAYGLPKGKHKSAVLVTCRKDDDARTMVRTGRVFRPPKLEPEDGWELFKREYEQAKKLKDAKHKDGKDGKGEDMLFKELEQMKEQIVNKCLGLPVAIVEAAKGFALSDLDPLQDASPPKEAAAAKPAEDQTVSSKDMQAGEEAEADKSEN